MFADMHNMPVNHEFEVHLKDSKNLTFSLQLFETSAKDDSQSNHVESIFLTLAHKLKNSRPMMPHRMSQWGNERQNSSYDGDDVPSVRLQTGLNCRPAVDNDSSCFGC